MRTGAGAMVVAAAGSGSIRWEETSIVGRERDIVQGARWVDACGPVDGRWDRSSGRAGGLFLADDRDPDDLAVEDHIAADEALALEDGMPAMQPLALADEHEPVAGPDLAAEPDVLHAAEGDEALRVQADPAAVEAGELGGGL